MKRLLISKIGTLLTLFLLLVGCAKHPAEQGSVVPASNKYAVGFQLTETDTAVIVEVFKPYQRMVIKEPLRRIGTMSTVQVGFLYALDAMDALVAVCNPELVYTPLKGTETDLGDSMKPSVERVLQAGLDALLAVNYGQYDNLEAARLDKLGVPVIYINEWQEGSPLARAEWIRPIGALVGKLHEADSLFNEIESKYLSLSAAGGLTAQCSDSAAVQQHSGLTAQRSDSAGVLTAEHSNSEGVLTAQRSDSEGVLTAQRSNSAAVLQPEGRSIMSGNNFRGTWYVPSGKNYLAYLFKDAGAQYPFYDDDRATSIPLTMEETIHYFHDADVWVGAGGNSLAELAQMDEKHTWFRAYQTGRVYNWRKQRLPGGANNFWERGVVHPEEMLEDVINILNNAPDSVLHFANRLY
ncbi:MAG: ABC transporter substrate-binding protein [Paludibacteraceae bacterium]|nr:ABC transporter substrate-binding protein [Paludibacteraceae bacterium]